MDQARLPLVAADSDLNQAIVAMKDNNCSGVVVELASGARVLDIDTILHTLRKEGNVKVRSVKARVRTTMLPGHLSVSAVMTNGDTRMDVQELMDRESAVYAFADVVGGMGRLVTRHEAYRDVLAAVPSMWRCRQVSTDVWLTHELRQPGNKCRNDGSDVDPI